MIKFLETTASQFGLLNRSARLLLLTIFFDGLLFTVFNLFLNLYVLESGYSREFLGLLNSAPSISALVASVPMGLLSDRMGRKRAMFAGFFLANTFIVMMMLVHNPVLMILLSFAYGATGQLYMISQAPFMMKITDDRSRDFLFSVGFGMFPLANALGDFMAGYLPGLFRDLLNISSPASTYQAVILFGVIGSYVALIPLAMIREPRSISSAQEPGHAPGKASVWKILSRPNTLKLAIPNLVIGLGTSSLVPFLNVFYSERGMTNAALGTLFSIGSLVTGIACMIGPRLVGRLGGKIRTIVLGQLTSAGLVLLIGFSPWAWLSIFGFIGRVALMNMAAPLFDAFALERTTENEHGAVNSIRSVTWSIGWAAGTFLSGIVQQRWGFVPLFICTPVFYVTANILIWLFFKPTKHENRSPLPPDAMPA